MKFKSAEIRTNTLAISSLATYIHRAYHTQVLSLSQLYEANRKSVAIPNILLAHNLSKEKNC